MKSILAACAILVMAVVGVAAQCATAITQAGCDAGFGCTWDLVLNTCTERCSEHTIRQGCEDSQLPCHWHSVLRTCSDLSCSNHTTQARCDAGLLNGLQCSWNNASSTCNNCSDYTTQADCDASQKKCSWDTVSSTCTAVTICRDLHTQAGCDASQWLNVSQCSWRRNMPLQLSCVGCSNHQTQDGCYPTADGLECSWNSVLNRCTAVQTPAPTPGPTPVPPTPEGQTPAPPTPAPTSSVAPTPAPTPVSPTPEGQTPAPPTPTPTTAVPTSAASYCAVQSSCGDCVDAQMQSCAWCGSTSKCVVAVYNGADTGSCGGSCPSVNSNCRLQQSQCKAADTCKAQSSSCSACLANSQVAGAASCGWCPSTSTCSSDWLSDTCGAGSNNWDSDFCGEDSDTAGSSTSNFGRVVVSPSYTVTLKNGDTGKKALGDLALTVALILNVDTSDIVVTNQDGDKITFYLKGKDGAAIRSAETNLNNAKSDPAVASDLGFSAVTDGPSGSGGESSHVAIYATLGVVAAVLVVVIIVVIAKVSGGKKGGRGAAAGDDTAGQKLGEMEQELVDPGTATSVPLNNANAV